MEQETEEWISIVYYKRWSQMLLSMPAELRHKIHDAIDEYIVSRTEPSDESVKYSPFWAIKEQIIYDKQLYNDRIVRRNQQNGNKGGRPKKNPNNPVGFSKPKKPDTVTVTVTDTVSTIVDNKKISSKEDTKKAKRTAFVPPTLKEIENYISENNYNVNAEKFINHYESNGWMVGRNKMKDWKATVRTWNSRGDYQQDRTTVGVVFKEDEQRNYKNGLW